MPAAKWETYYKTHRMTVISTLAVVAGAIFAALALKNRASVVVTTAASPAGATPTTAPVYTGAYGSSYAPPALDPTGFFNAGASAAALGLGTAERLGGNALGLAGDVVGTQGYSLQELAQSQASGISALGDLMQTIFKAQPAAIPVAAAPWGAPPPGAFDIVPTPPHLSPTPGPIAPTPGPIRGTPAPAPVAPPPAAPVAPPPAAPVATSGRYTATALSYPATIYANRGGRWVLFSKGATTMRFTVRAGHVLGTDGWVILTPGTYLGAWIMLHDPAWSINP